MTLTAAPPPLRGTQRPGSDPGQRHPRCATAHFSLLPALSGQSPNTPISRSDGNCYRGEGRPGGVAERTTGGPPPARTAGGDQPGDRVGGATGGPWGISMMRAVEKSGNNKGLINIFPTQDPQTDLARGHFSVPPPRAHVPLARVVPHLSWCCSPNRWP